MSYLFVFRASPDIDHMAPLAWRLLEDGEEVHVVLSRGYDPRSDHRLELLGRYPKFRLHETWPASGSALKGYLRSTLPYALVLLKRSGARLVAVEWGYGLRAAYERPRSLSGAIAAARSLARSLVKAREPTQVRSNYLVAARLLGLATVSLPHGVTVTYEAPNEQLLGLLERDELDWSNRNQFDAFVFNTEHHRQWYVEHAKVDPHVMQTWGSLRWAPQWFELNMRLAPPFEWPDGEDGRVKVVYMLPKWRNRVHADEVVELVRRLHVLDFVSLAIMGHPRLAGANGSDPLRSAAGIDWSRVHDLDGEPSVSVIRACDVLMTVGSSIALEAVMQDKVLLNPVYTQELSSLFEAIPGSSVVARNPGEVVDYLAAHAGGSPHRMDDATREALMRQAVYGNRGAPFDVLGYYSERVRELAGAAS